jgi:hypothetical protein
VYVIARRLGLDPKTVRRYADAPDPEALIGPNGTARDSILDRFKPYLQQRCAAGVTATNQLLAEIRARGYTGGERTLRRWLIGIRGTDGSVPAPPPVPPARDITGWIMRPVDKLTDDDRAELQRLCGLCPTWPRSGTWPAASPSWSAPAAASVLPPGSSRPTKPPSPKFARSPTAYAKTGTRSRPA